MGWLLLYKKTGNQLLLIVPLVRFVDSYKLCGSVSKFVTLSSVENHR